MIVVAMYCSNNSSIPTGASSRLMRVTRSDRIVIRGLVSTGSDRMGHWQTIASRVRHVPRLTARNGISDCPTGGPVTGRLACLALRQK